MDIEARILQLEAENRALQSILMGFMIQFVGDPTNPTGLAPLVADAFSYAEHVGEIAAARFPDRKELIESVKIVEQLRAAVLPPNPKPKDAV